MTEEERHVYEGQERDRPAGDAPMADVETPPAGARAACTSSILVGGISTLFRTRVGQRRPRPVELRTAARLAPYAARRSQGVKNG
jgi:hypothetical protein